MPKKFVKKTVGWLMQQRIIRYSIGGGMAALIDLGLFWFFVEITNLHYLIASVFSFIVSVGFGYFFQKYITFEDYTINHTKQLTKFVFYQCLGQIFYMVLLWLGIDVLSIHYLIVAVFAKGIVFIWNYGMNKLFNFTS